MANIRNNRWSRRGYLKESTAPRDQHPQVRREDETADDSVEALPEDSDIDEK